MVYLLVTKVQGRILFLKTTSSYQNTSDISNQIDMTQYPDYENEIDKYIENWLLTASLSRHTDAKVPLFDIFCGIQVAVIFSRGRGKTSTDQVNHWGVSRGHRPNVYMKIRLKNNYNVQIKMSQNLVKKSTRYRPYIKCRILRVYWMTPPPRNEFLRLTKFIS